MGVSTDGILVFGIDIGEERPAFLDDVEEHDFEEFVADQLDIPRPEHDDYRSPDWSDYFRAKQDAGAKFPVALVTHCSYEYPMYILAVNGTEISARRGYPVEVDPATDLVITDEQRAAFKEFCEKHGVEWREPQWLLCSMWG